MTKTDRAGELFKSGFNCSQAVFTAFKQDSIDEKTALKLSTIFGAGVAAQGAGVCGAVSGALMAISLKHGRENLEAVDAKTKTYELGRQFMAKFEEENGSVMCEKLLGINIGTPENMQKANEAGLFKTKCYNLVLSAGKILEGL